MPKAHLEFLNRQFFEMLAILRKIFSHIGPQDHGWCLGYTCQKRISTFYTIVATGKSFNIFFTGYAPRKLRFHLLNVDDSSSLRVAVW